MNATEKAVAATFYRLVYEQRKMRLKDVPEQYRKILAAYKKATRDTASKP